MADDDFDKPPPGMNAREYREWRRNKSREWREWMNTAEGERARRDAEDEIREQRRRSDEAWEDAVKDLLGKNINETLKDIQNAPAADDRVKKAIKAIRDAQDAAKGGVFRAPNPGKAKKIIKANQGHIKHAAKKGKKGCWLFTCIMALLALAVGAATTWGGVEVVEALAR